MAFRQYTKCVPPKNFSTLNEYVSATLQAVLVGGPLAAAIALAAAEPWCYAFVAEITVMAWVVAFCDWWLYGRLICLDGDKSAVGMLVSTEPVDNKEGFERFDTDFSINLLLYDNEPGPPGKTLPELQAAAEARPPYGELIKNQPAIIDLDQPFRGEFATDIATGVKSAILHAEFEGAGIRDLQIGAQAALGVSIAALIVCLAVPPPWDLAIAAILAVAAFIIALIGALLGLFDSAGAPTDVNPALGTLNINTTNDAGNATGADLLYVQGTWIFDSFHEGWNEIHPIKVCSRVGTWDGDWPADPGWIDDVTTGFDDAQSYETKTNQEQPENDWDVHPDIDGCQVIDIE